MNLQIINDNLGTPKGVFIPINDWEEFKLKYSINDISLNQIDEIDISESIKTSIIEMSKIENGELAKKSAFELLKEL